MKHPVLWAVLLYLSLDLSLAIVPGAFVFEPADSVESLQTGRARATTEVVVMPTATGAATELALPRRELKPRAGTPRREPHRAHRVAHDVSAPQGDAARSGSPEDPH